MPESTDLTPEENLPKVTIKFCTQCKWMLRAAYYAQELLSTFSLLLGQVALQPSTGGVFTVTITTLSSPITSDPASQSTNTSPNSNTITLWDRSIDGGFPETKELKRRVRDVIAPGKNLGHVDRNHRKEEEAATAKEKEKEEGKGEAGAGEEKQQGVEGEEGKEDEKRLGQRSGTGTSVIGTGPGNGIAEGESHQVCEDCA